MAVKAITKGSTAGPRAGRLDPQILSPTGRQHILEWKAASALVLLAPPLAILSMLLFSIISDPSSHHHLFAVDIGVVASKMRMSVAVGNVLVDSV